MGDFNTSPGMSDSNVMVADYYDSWSEAVKKGTASSAAGTTGCTHGGSPFDSIYESKSASAPTLDRFWW